MNLILIGLLLNFLYLVICTHTEVDLRKHQNIDLIPSDCGVSYKDKIIGGSQAGLGQYPWLAKIGYILPNCSSKVRYRCGGVLISRRYVLTAAHCATDLPVVMCSRKAENVTFAIGDILIGEYDTRTDPDCVKDECAPPVQHFKPGKIMVHALYNYPQYSNDVALIRLRGTVKLSDWTFPACLPRGELLRSNHRIEKATVAGWGTTNLTTPGNSPVPMSVTLPILPMSKCIDSFMEKLNLSNNKQICAGGEKDKDSCGGDSGGPLTHIEAQDGQPRYYVIGLVSFGVKHCGKKGKPAVYTRLSYYMDWILDHMEP